MASQHTVQDLILMKKIYDNSLCTKVLQDFYTMHLTPNVYIFELSNGNGITLLFEEDSFCHLIGLSYFGYNGEKGWSDLLKSPKIVSQFSSNQNYGCQKYRINNFNQIVSVLSNPQMYIYKSSEHPDLSYKSDYFAVYSDGTRYYKLGIGTTKTMLNYPETFQVSLIAGKDNKEIDPKNLLKVISKKVINKSTYINDR